MNRTHRKGRPSAGAGPKSPDTSGPLRVHPFWDSVVIPIVLTVLGTTALIGAWRSQTVVLSAATDTRLSLQRSQLVISLWEAKRDQWVVAMNQELTKTSPVFFFA
jgi:hypothetical protein